MTYRRRAGLQAQDVVERWRFDPDFRAEWRRYTTLNRRAQEVYRRERDAVLRVERRRLRRGA